MAAELSERPPAVPAKVGVQQPGQPSATKDIDAGTHRESVAVTANPSLDLPTAREAIENALNTGLNYLAARFNMTAKGVPAIVRTEFAQNVGTHIRWVDGLKACQPAYAQTPRFLLLATNPQLVRNFVAREATNKTESCAKSRQTGRGASRSLTDVELDPSPREAIFSDGKPGSLHRRGCHSTDYRRAPSRTGAIRQQHPPDFARRRRRIPVAVPGYRGRG